MRGPYDIANFGLLFALPENKSKAAVFKNGLTAIKRGQDRRNPNKMAIKVDAELSDQEEWVRTELDLGTVTKKELDLSVDEPAVKKIKVNG